MFTPIRFVRFSLLLCVVAGFFACPAARAHDPMASWAVAQPAANGLRFTFSLTVPEAIVYVRNVEPASNVRFDAPFEKFQPLLLKHAADFFELRAGDAVLAPLESKVVLTEDEMIEIHLLFPWPEGDLIQFRAKFLEHVSQDHSTYLSVLDQNEHLLAGAMPTIEEPVIVAATPPRPASIVATKPPPTNASATAATTAVASTQDASAQSATPASTKPAAPAAPTGVVAHKPTFREFVLLGIEHILTGYDHLLFLAGLLVACRHLRSMVKIVTFFTIAHSITLALAALNVVNITSRVVEPLIAATIVFVAIENLVRNDEPQKRWMLTFAFGLVHGFGFASVLKEMGVGRNGSSIVVPLFSFNLGVEIGQLMVVALVLPLLLSLRRRPVFVRYALPAFSVAVALLGGYWFYQRVFIG